MFQLRNWLGKLRKTGVLRWRKDLPCMLLLVVVISDFDRFGFPPQIVFQLLVVAHRVSPMKLLNFSVFEFSTFQFLNFGPSRGWSTFRVVLTLFGALLRNESRNC